MLEDGQIADVVKKAMGVRHKGDTYVVETNGQIKVGIALENINGFGEVVIDDFSIVPSKELMPELDEDKLNNLTIKYYGTMMSALEGVGQSQNYYNSEIQNSDEIIASVEDDTKKKIAKSQKNLVFI